ncbi:MAG: hypothetical protein DMF64_06145 [Acidobacteria bacterium]|nr:MAG: hypothetical protein DMF64_06145 [Acidobacteriota bacterium]
MTQILERTESAAWRVNLRPVIALDDKQFEELCRRNRDLRIEMTAEGDLIIMPPTFGRTGNRNAKLTQRFGNWTDADGTGVAFDSSTLFALPNGAKRSPDVSWVSRARLAQLTDEQKEKFLPLCPDFVIELRSSSDSLAELQAKMREYMENGAQLGWLLDPQEKRVYVYKADSTVEQLDAAETIAGDPLLPGFVLNLQQIWEADF